MRAGKFHNHFIPRSIQLRNCRSTRFNSRYSDSAIARESARASRRGRTTMSRPTGKTLRWRRYASRMQRFQKLRVGEFPTFLETLKPMRLYVRVVRIACTTKVRSASTKPRSNTAANSSRPRSLRNFGKHSPRTTSEQLDAPELRAVTLAAFELPDESSAGGFGVESLDVLDRLS